MIVVDLGCKSHEGEVSIPRLLRRYAPDVLFGFDPYPELEEGVSRVGVSVVVTRRAAAWVKNEPLRFAVDGTRSNIVGETQAATIEVPGFDFAAWLALLPEPPVVKMDVEGAEYPLLLDLIIRGETHLIRNLLIEWHPQSVVAYDQDELLAQLECPVEEW